MRRGPAFLLLLLLLGGCLTTGDRTSPELFYGVGEAKVGGGRLQPYATLEGVVAGEGGVSGSVLRGLTGSADRVSIARQPVALGAGEHGIYLIDGFNNALYRVAWASQSTFADSQPVGQARQLAQPAESTRLRTLNDLRAPNGLFVGPNGDLFVSDGTGNKIVRYDGAGHSLQEFADPKNLSQPAAVTVDERGLRIFIADSREDHVVVFDRQGRSLYGIGFHGEGQGGITDIRCMALGPDGLLYLATAKKRRVDVFGLDGTYIGSFGSGTFSDPTGIAVDDDNRVYVADGFESRIFIFADGKLVETFGRRGARAGEFRQPASLAYYRGMLYVADRDNGRVQVFKVIAEKSAKPAGGGPS